MLGIADNPRKEYTSPKGGKFVITTDNTGFYIIVMENGGVRPKVCEGKYTSFHKADHKLQEYFKANPKPVPREKAVAKD